MTEKVKKGNEKSEFPLKRNFSKNTNTARIKKNKQTLPVSSEENLNENTKSKYLPNKKDDINSKNKEEKVYIIPLGGIEEVGKNMTAFQYKDRR